MAAPGFSRGGGGGGGKWWASKKLGGGGHAPCKNEAGKK